MRGENQVCITKYLDTNAFLRVPHKGILGGLNKPPKIKHSQTPFLLHILDTKGSSSENINILGVGIFENSDESVRQWIDFSFIYKDY